MVPKADRQPKAARPSSGAHVALIRGINVGRAKRVAMADLRAIVEKLGYEDVRTLLNSGNVVFRAAKGTGAAAGIERAMKAKLGVSAQVVVLGAADLAAIVKENPLAKVATNPSRLMVAVPIDGDLSRLKPLAKEDWKPEALALGRRAAYFWCPDGLLESRLGVAMYRTHGERLTIRNWATITKLQALTRDD